VDSTSARQAGELFEALFLAPMLRPLMPSGGPLGDYELDALAREIAHRDARGFAALIAASLERAR